MSEYVAKVSLEVNGQEITDFKAVSEGGRTLRKQVPLMNKTGHTNVTQRYTASVDYVVPSDAPEFDFDSVEGGTLTIDKGNGSRVTYGGVCTLEVGETKYDGDNEAVKTISLSAETRTEA
ncbi:MAG: hypothetical protein V1791_10825 [Pseudomonadota bacterium]